MAETSSLHLALKDGMDGLRAWPIWTLMAENDIRQRYRRSVIGPFWLTISMLLTVVALGFIYSTLFRMEIKEYLPYVATGLISWGLLSGILNEAGQVFISAEGYLKQVPLPKTVFVLRQVLRLTYIYFHNLLIFPLLMLVFGTPLNMNIFLILPALALVLLNCLWVTLFLGILCTRFRDLPQIITSLVTLAFFVTPILWHPNLLTPDMQFIAHFNPLTSLLNLMREPLLGNAPLMLDWLVALALLIVGGIITLLFFRKYRSRITYWL